MLVIVPHAGYYESLHSRAVDDALEQMFSDRDTGCQRNEGLESAVFRECNFHKVYEAYSKEYVVSFARHFNIPSLVFESMISPREYNFTSDRTYANISEEDVHRLRAETGETNLQRMATRMFTSYDGFSSFYDPDVDTWGELATWDANQVGCLMAAYAEHDHGEPFDQWAEYDLMDGDFGNGKPEDWIAENTPGIERLYKIHDYLEVRAAR